MYSTGQRLKFIFSREKHLNIKQWGKKSLGASSSQVAAMCAAKTRGPPRGCTRSSALPAVCALMSSLESAGCSGGCLLCSALIAVSYSIQPVELESVQKCSAPWLRLQTIANQANALFHWQGNSLCIRSLGVIQPIFCEARGSSVRGDGCVEMLQAGKKKLELFKDHTVQPSSNLFIFKSRTQRSRPM